MDSRIAWLETGSKCISGCRDHFGDFTERQRDRLRISRRTGRATTIYTTTSLGGLAGGADGVSTNIRFALSGSFLAVLTASDFDGREQSTFDVGLAAGPRPRSTRDAPLGGVIKCSGMGLSGSGSSFALSGALLVHDATPCESEIGPGRIGIRDLATGSRRVEQLPDGRVLVGLATAGRFVAASLAKSHDYGDPNFEAEHFVALFDRERPGAIVTASAGEYGPAFDVQSDGRVAICSQEGRLSTFSPTQRQPRELGSCAGSPKIARDRVVFREPGGNVAVSDPRGRRETVFPLGAVETPYGLDFDGRSVVYAAPRCVRGTEILRTRVTTRARGRPYAKCPAIIRSPKRLRVTRQGRAKFGLGCPRGCNGHFGMNGAGYQVASGFFNRRPGRSVVRTRLDRYGRRLLRRRGGLRVKLTIVVYDRDGKRSRTRRTLRLTR